MDRRKFLAQVGAVPLVAAAAPSGAESFGKPVMKITGLKATAVSRHFVFVRVYTDAGIVGLGEATLEGKPETQVAAVRELEQYLVGEDPTRIEHLWQKMYRFPFYRGGPVMNSAIGGVDIALWDIYGKYLKQPIYELLGGPTRGKVRVYAHVGGKTPQEMADNAKKLVAEGFRALKTSPPPPLRMVEGRRAIREIVAHIAPCATPWAKAWT